MKIFFMAMMTIFPPCALALPTDNAAIALEGLVAERIDADSREGLATYYAKRFEWRRTTSGEKYNPYMLTAAHASFPIGSVVMVEDPTTSRNVIVRINDRCHSRHSSTNLIDLSRVAAQQIGFWGKGMKRVMISELDGLPYEDEQLLQELVE